jgi:hypothetical protein
MSDQREMTLDEWCAQLPASHRVNKELTAARKEIEELRKDGPDAKRYRFFKRHLSEPYAIQHFVAFNNWHPSDAAKLRDLDTFIDDAIEKERE